MSTTTAQDERMANLTFASVFPHYVNKVLKKGRTLDELYQVIYWLTGFTETDLQKLIEDKVTFKTFFERANIPPNASNIKGVICGFRVEEIANPLSRNIRYLDKLIDELAKGKPLNKVIR